MTAHEPIETFFSSKLYDDAELKVKFMHPFGPSKGFKWPEPEDKLRVPIYDVLCVIAAPVTRNGRSYALSVEDVKKISQA